MRTFALALALAAAVPACAGDSGDDLSGEVADPGSGKADGDARPSGVFYLTAGATQSGAFEALELDGESGELYYVLAKGGDDDATRVKIRGTFTFTKTDSRKYIRFTGEDPDTGDALPVVRYQYSWSNGKLSLHQRGVAGGWSMKPVAEAAPDDALEDAVHARYSELADSGTFDDALANVGLTEVPVMVRARFDVMDVMWGEDYPPLLYFDSLDGKPVYWMTENNDGGGYAGAFNADGELIDEGWYSESEDFEW